MFQKMKDISKVRNKVRGDCGEIVAVNFLKKKKYKIIQTNYKNKLGEIDIIAEHKGIYVFVEVKKRSTKQYGRPVEAVDFRKRSKIKKVAEIYLMMNNANFVDVRFDVIEIIDDEINHIENAFSDF